MLSIVLRGYRRDLYGRRKRQRDMDGEYSRIVTRLHEWMNELGGVRLHLQIGQRRIPLSLVLPPTHS